MDRKLDSFSERDRFRVNHIHDEAKAVLVIRAMCDCFPCCALMSLVDSGIVSLRDATEAFKKSYKPITFPVGWDVSVGEQEEWDTMKRLDI